MLPPTAPDHGLDLPPARLVLMPERAAFDPATGTLFVADLHLGKAAVFRARGIPVPRGSTADTLARLGDAVTRSGATHVAVLGDLLHARESRGTATVDAVADWRARHPQVAWSVVEGNHDRHAGRLHASLGIRTVDEPFVAGPLHGVHDPADAVDTPDTWTLAGHVHPVVTLRSRHDRMRLPCFWRRGRLLVLPAFGAFTGGHDVTRLPGDDVFVVAGTRVAPLHARPAPHRPVADPPG